MHKMTHLCSVELKFFPQFHNIINNGIISFLIACVYHKL